MIHQSDIKAKIEKRKFQGKKCRNNKLDQEQETEQ